MYSLLKLVQRYLVAFDVMRYRPRWFLIISALNVDWFCLLKIAWHFLNTFRLMVLYAKSFSASWTSIDAIKLNVWATQRWCGGNDAFRSWSMFCSEPRALVISTETSIAPVKSISSFVAESLSFLPYTQ